MSATGRTDGVRQEKDHYITPGWALQRLLEAYRLPEGATVLDPCAANGELLSELNRLRPDLRLMAFEVRAECTAALSDLTSAGVLENFAIGSFPEMAKSIEDDAIDFVLTNPPYSMAQEFVEMGNRIAKIGNIHLLRINFVGAQRRRDWTAKTRPGFFVLPNRPSFTGWGGDATEYAWFVYKDPEMAGRWAILQLTPDETVSAWNKRARLLFPDLKPSRSSIGLNE